MPSGSATFEVGGTAAATFDFVAVNLGDEIVVSQEQGTVVGSVQLVKAGASLPTIAVNYGINLADLRHMAPGSFAWGQFGRCFAFGVAPDDLFNEANFDLNFLKGAERPQDIELAMFSSDHLEPGQWNVYTSGPLTLYMRIKERRFGISC